MPWHKTVINTNDFPLLYVNCSVNLFLQTQIYLNPKFNSIILIIIHATRTRIMLETFLYPSCFHTKASLWARWTNVPDYCEPDWATMQHSALYFWNCIEIAVLGSCPGKFDSPSAQVTIVSDVERTDSRATLMYKRDLIYGSNI